MVLEVSVVHPLYSGHNLFAFFLYDYQIPYIKSVLGEIHFCFVRSDVNLTARDAKNAQGSPRFESIV